MMGHLFSWKAFGSLMIESAVLTDGELEDVNDEIDVVGSRMVEMVKQ